MPGPSAYFAFRAYSTTYPSPSTLKWILDSSASHHITTDLGNLSLHYPYSGHDNVLIGNGNILSISHIDSLTLPTSSSSLTLNNVLCVPAMKKNLIFISQLCTTNHVYVTFLLNVFQVKDLRTRALVHQGLVKDGVYV